MNNGFDFSNFDANKVDTSYTGEREPIPAGIYEAMITSSEMKQTNAGNGSYLAIGLTIVSGEYERRMVFDNVNLVNPSEKAREIGHRTLAKIMKAVGKPKVVSHEELRNIPMLVKVSVRPAEGNYAARNEVKDYAPDPSYVQTEPPAPQVAPVAQQYAPPPSAAPVAPTAQPATPANPAAAYPRAPWVR